MIYVVNPDNNQVKLVKENEDIVLENVSECYYDPFSDELLLTITNAQVIVELNDKDDRMTMVDGFLKRKAEAEGKKIEKVILEDDFSNYELKEDDFGVEEEDSIFTELPIDFLQTISKIVDHFGEE